MFLSPKYFNKKPEDVFQPKRILSSLEFAKFVIDKKRVKIKILNKVFKIESILGYA
tara:strand:- start:397 stop:564 length:168 start_codon:yes stop_codon:yes gene_type:complete